MTCRYFVPQLCGDAELALPDEEAQHASRVMRVRPGDAVQLFDGQGAQAAATVVRVDRRAVLCRCGRPEVVDRETAAPIVVGVALPKGDRAKLLVEKLTELGVARLVPLECQRAQWSASSSLLERLRRTVIEACKQSGRNRLMQIEAPEPCDAFFEGSGAAESSEPPLRWLADPAGTPLPWERLAHPLAQGAWIAIGPEGGFTDAERQGAERIGWSPVALGPRILRVETAAIALAALLSLR